MEDNEVGKEVLLFLKEYKALECSCCDRLMGFQHRATGRMVCQPQCRQTRTSLALEASMRFLRTNLGFEENVPSSKNSHESEMVTPKLVTPEPQNNPVEVVPERSAAKEGNVSKGYSSTLSKLTPLSVLRSANRGAQKAEDAVDSQYSKLAQARCSVFKPLAGTSGNGGAVFSKPLAGAGGSGGSGMLKPLAGTSGNGGAVFSKPLAGAGGSGGYGKLKLLAGTSGTGGSGMPAMEPIRMDVNPFYKGFEPAKLLADMKRNASYVHTQKDFPEMNRPRTTPEPSSAADTFSPKVGRKSEVVTEEVRFKAPAPREREPAQIPSPRETVPVQTPPPRETEPVQTPPPKERAPARRERPTASATNKGTYNWLSCTYSSNLYNGAEVKVSFQWGVHKYQVFAEKDEEIIMQLQDKIKKHAESTKKLSRTPVMDEILLGVYLEDYYRGRVIEVTEDKVKLLFVDFGDCEYNDIKQLVEPSQEIMEHPIYGATITLVCVPSDIVSKKIQRKINPFVFGPLRVEFIDNLVIGPGEQECLTKLWISDEDHLNDIIQDIIKECMK